MKLVKWAIENGLLTIHLIGRIDSSNAKDAEEQIELARKESKYNDIVIDAGELQYISSAGLRVILRLRKNEPNLKIINVSNEVYDILDMTGFTEMIPIQKAYRSLAVDNCEIIGQGANGMVYRIDPDTIVKVYINPDALPDIQRERELARCAFVLGIPTAIPYDVVKVGEAYGSVFELLNAKSFAQLIQNEPEHLEEYVELSVNLLKKIHSTLVKPDTMPDMRSVAIGWAQFLRDYLPQDTGEKLLKLIEEIPVDYHMMHGDYHQKNIMMQNGEALLIDMDTLCYGNPIFEFASMFNAYVGFSVLDHSVVERFLGIPYETSLKIWKRSLEMYFDSKDPSYISDVERKSMLIGYTRLLRRTLRRNGMNTEKGRKEIEYYQKSIIELVDVIETLEI